ncbi:MAG: hypothetical protein HY926_06070 [Elusimicrobia bacterium]|nr:hypothetical protein [Elusimicrobiota bacterium]
MARVRKVIFFVESTFCRRDYERFGFETLRRQGFAVEAWDFTRLLVRAQYHPVQPPDPLDWAGLRVFADRAEAACALSGLDGSCFVVAFISYIPESLWIFRALGRRGARYGVQLPALYTGGAARSLWRQRLRIFRWRDIPRYLARRLPTRWLVPPADLGLAWARRHFICQPFVPGASETLWVHALDYDRYLEERDQPASGGPPTAVFLDQYMPFHSDFAHSGLGTPIAAEEYFPRLRAFFDSIESAFGVRVVVAAHPRSAYESCPGCFGDREIARGRTCALVRDSRLVLLHQSMAVSFPVLFRKPMVFVGGSRVSAGLVEEPRISELAAFFGKREHDLERPADFDVAAELRVDDAAYERFQDGYIKSRGSAELPYWEIVARRLAEYR